MTGLSFEFFPPRTETGAKRLDRAITELARFSPDYVSVTYGAGGSTADGTLRTLNRIRQRTGTPTASHLCFSGVAKAQTDAFADKIWRDGHRRVVTLRGDADEAVGQGYGTVPEFVAALRERHPFEIAVACYPEIHPRAESLEQDLDVLLAKQEAGATHALSQFFFDPEVFFAFHARARAHGITIPIVPGLLAVHDVEAAISFGDKCGSPVPQWVRERFMNAERAGLSERDVAEALIVEAVRELCANGVRDLHLYTLNRWELCDAAAKAFREHHPVARAA